MGQIGSYSFFPSKNLGACGDAGLISTDDDTLAANLRCLRVHGQREKYIHAELGINSRLDSVKAAILRVKLKHLDVWNQARREVAVRYAQLFADRGIASADPNVPTPAEVTAPQEPEGYESVYHQYVVRVHESRRDKVFEALHQARIGCSIYYPLALHMQPCFADLGGREGQFPVAERACRETLALPIFPEMTLEQQERVVDVIAGVLKA